MRGSIGHFSLYGDFHLEEVTAALGLEPSSVTPKGTLYEGAEFPSKVSEWELYCPEESTMLEQLQFLLDALWPRAEVLRTLANQYTADFNLSGERFEVMEIKADMLDRLAKLHVNLNCFFEASEIHVGGGGPAEQKGTR